MWLTVSMAKMRKNRIAADIYGDISRNVSVIPIRSHSHGLSCFEIPAAHVPKNDADFGLRAGKPIKDDLVRLIVVSVV